MNKNLKNLTWKRLGKIKKKKGDKLYIKWKFFIQ